MTTYAKNKAGAPAQPPTLMAGYELAAFSFWFFKMNAGTIANPAFYGSFAGQNSQVSAIKNATAAGTDNFSKLVLKFANLASDGTIGPLIGAAQGALANLYQALINAGDWGSCEALDLSLLQAIAQLDSGGNPLP